VLIPLVKTVPVNITSNVAPSAAVDGEMLDTVGAGFPVPPAIHLENPSTPVRVIVFEPVLTLPPCNVHVDPTSGICRRSNVEVPLDGNARWERRCCPGHASDRCGSRPSAGGIDFHAHSAEGLVHPCRADTRGRKIAENRVGRCLRNGREAAKRQDM
jgi:hypothetical protein